MFKWYKNKYKKCYYYLNTENYYLKNNYLQPTTSKLWQNNCEIIYHSKSILKFGPKLKLALYNLNFIANISILLPF